jgi:hypothetical protein
MTYAEAEKVYALARDHGFDNVLVPMKTTHNTVVSELVIGRDLTWLWNKAMADERQECD